jgi:predicted nuclease with TOPRIM domain
MGCTSSLHKIQRDFEQTRLKLDETVENLKSANKTIQQLETKFNIANAELEATRAKLNEMQGYSMFNLPSIPSMFSSNQQNLEEQSQKQQKENRQNQSEQNPTDSYMSLKCHLFLRQIQNQLIMITLIEHGHHHHYQHRLLLMICLNH